jgi:hypothetical protein
MTFPYVLYVLNACNSEFLIELRQTPTFLVLSTFLAALV